MWALLSRRRQLQIILVVSFIVAWAFDGLWLFVVGERPSIPKTLSLVVAIIAVPLVAVANRIWRFLILRFPSIQSRTFPDLSGKWTGEMKSTWIEPRTKKAKEPIAATIVIRMNLFSLSVSLKTEESNSDSTRAFLEPFYDTRRFRIWYTYTNDPQARVRRRSPPHEGVAFLDMDFDVDTDRLVGRYYTARETTGDIDVRRVVDPAVD